MRGPGSKRKRGSSKGEIRSNRIGWCKVNGKWRGIKND